MIDNITYNRLTKKEKDLIEKITDKASKRRHKVKFGKKFLMEYITSISFLKAWDYDERLDVMDLLRVTTKLATQVGHFTEKKLKNILNIM